MDQNDPNPLDERKEQILREIVEAYVRRGEPVGSKVVADATDLGLSSATIRNEMAILEREGYISHPHTSAGRTPTDKGYRYYVDVLAPRVGAGRTKRREIEHNLVGTFSALDELLERTSQLLTELTDYTSLAASPSLRESRIARIELVRLGSHRLLLICVGEDGWHDDRIIELPTDVNDAMIADALRFANDTIADATPSEAAMAVDNIAAPSELHDLLRGIGEALRAVSRTTMRLYTGGTAKLVVWEPVDTAQQVLELLKGGVVEPLLPEPAPNTVTVRIGRELALGDVRDLSLITTGYQLGRRAGTVGVLGPTRMDYPMVISTVVEVASTLSRVLRQLAP
ncbi:MAG: heat-inducible transcriptional repressor HrcA [Actinomycetota bacterium]